MHFVDAHWLFQKEQVGELSAKGREQVLPLPVALYDAICSRSRAQWLNVVSTEKVLAASSDSTDRFEYCAPEQVPSHCAVLQERPKK